MLVQPSIFSCVVHRLPLKILLVGFVEDEPFIDLQPRVMPLASIHKFTSCVEETRDEKSDWHKEGYFRRRSFASD